MTILSIELLRRNVDIDRQKGHLPATLIDYYADATNQDLVTLEDWFRQRDTTYELLHSETPLCRGKPSTSHLMDSLIRVVALDDFLRFHLAPTTATDALATRRAKCMSTMVPGTPFGSSHLYGNLRGGRDLFWLAPLSAMHDCADSFDPAVPLDRKKQWATLVRDALGLPYDIAQPLVILIFHPPYFTSASIPTFVDAGAHPNFCNWLDESADCGAAWHCCERRPGAPELVSRAHPLRTTATAIYLGEVKSVPTPIDPLGVPPS